MEPQITATDGFWKFRNVILEHNLNILRVQHKNLLRSLNILRVQHNNLLRSRDGRVTNEAYKANTRSHDSKRFEKTLLRSPRFILPPRGPLSTILTRETSKNAALQRKQSLTSLRSRPVQFIKPKVPLPRNMSCALQERQTQILRGPSSMSRSAVARHLQTFT